MKNPNRLPGDAERTTAGTPKLDQPVVQEGPKANSAGSTAPRPATEVRADFSAADPGDRLPATLEGWRARFPDLGAWAVEACRR